MTSVAKRAQNVVLMVDDAPYTAKTFIDYILKTLVDDE